MHFILQCPLAYKAISVIFYQIVTLTGYKAIHILELLRFFKGFSLYADFFSQRFVAYNTQINIFVGKLTNLYLLVILWCYA